MEKKIRSDLMKMTAIMVILAGLGIYAHEFVIAGIIAKAALNLIIFGLFGVAASIAFRHVIALTNEACLLYTSDAADDLLCVDIGGRRIIKKKKINMKRNV